MTPQQLEDCNFPNLAQLLQEAGTRGDHRYEKAFEEFCQLITNADELEQIKAEQNEPYPHWNQMTEKEKDQAVKMAF